MPTLRRRGAAGTRDARPPPLTASVASGAASGAAQRSNQRRANAAATQLSAAAESSAGVSLSATPASFPLGSIDSRTT